MRRSFRPSSWWGGRRPTPRRVFACGLLVGLLVTLGPAHGSATAAPQGVVRLFVDSATGSDEPAQPGTSEAPLRSLSRAVAVAKAAASEALEVVFAPGVYDPASGESFPVVLPPSLRLLRLIGTDGTDGTDGGTELMATRGCDALVLWEGASGDGAAVELELTGLRFSSGLAAAVVAGGAGARVEVTAERCFFAGQQARAIEASAGADGSVSVVVRDCQFSGAGSGVSFEALQGSSGEIRVESSVFDGAGDRYSVSAGVEVHLENQSDIVVTVERNTFRNLPAAVQLTAAEALPATAGGRLVVRVLGNLVYGQEVLGRSPTEEVSVLPRFGANHAIHLSLWPHHDVDLLVAQNTFAGIEGHVVHEDNLQALRSLSEEVPWTFANNICFAIRGDSEFAAELFEGLPLDDFASSESQVVVRANLLEKSRLRDPLLQGQSAQNFAGDPLFVRGGLLFADVPDFRLQAGSPALGRGEEAFAESLRVDLAGRCRRAAHDCSSSRAPFHVDVGAYERPGVCQESARFLRGDCDSLGDLELSDAIFLFGFLFLGGEPPVCPDACDSNDDGDMSMSDGILSLNFLFLGAAGLAPPAGVAGGDPTCDFLSTCGGVTEG